IQIIHWKLTHPLCDSRRTISKGTVRRKKKRRLIMIALFADGERNGETVAGRRKRARGKCGVGAGRIFEAIEIENKFAGFFEAVGWETGVEKAASGVCRRAA